MNIFFLHLIPSICAMMHADKHVIKMILESTQLLCSVHHIINSSLYKPPYKLTHKNHPCSIWTRASKQNYIWLCQLSKELCKEYTFRYGKIHKCEQYIDELTENIPLLPDIPFSTPAQAMPAVYKDSDDVVEAYRQYYFFEKIHIHSWKGKIAGRDTPQWITDIHELFE
jgi:hypothetical protein